MAVDLYRNPYTGWLLRNPRWQSLARWCLTVSLALLLAAAYGREKLPGVADSFPLIYTNAATLLFWIVWFMGLVLLAPLTGRSWCGVCPLGFLADRLGRVGLNLSWPGGAARHLALGLVFLSGIGAALFLDAHKSPHLTALTVGAALLLAALAGILWKRAAFCGFLCPVGVVLALYGRFSPLRVMPRESDKCAACRDRGCTKRGSSWKRWDIGTLVIHKKVFTSGCPVALDPPTMDASQCLLCMECVRNCTHDNLAVNFGKRTSIRPLGAKELLLLTPLSGLVALMLARTWPDLTEGFTPFASLSSWSWALWFGLLLPGILIFLPVLFQYLKVKASPVEVEEPGGKTPGAVTGRGSASFTGVAARMAVPFAGPVLGAHLALALVKLNAKAAYLPYLFYDPFGATTYMAVHVTRMLPLPPMVMAMGAIKILAPALLALGIVFGILEGVRHWGKPLGGFPRLLAMAGFAALSALYGATLIHWLYAGR